MKPNTLVSLSLAVLAFGVFAYADEDKAAKRDYNVILITLSTLRADHASCLGYARDTTSNFDEFCKEGVLFEKAFAVSSWAMPNHASIFTSLYPTFHGATHIDKRLDEKHATLAEALGANGYYCAGFCCNPRVTDDLGFAQGFDIYDDYSVKVVLESMDFGGKAVDINQRRTNDLINDAAMRWVRNNTHKPFFLFVHYYDNHWDYMPAEPYNRLYAPDYRGAIDGRGISKEPLFSNRPSDADVAHIVALYDGEVKRTDEDLGVFLKFLKDQGLMEKSIIVAAGDHGEQFYEHGNTSHHGIYEELIHVPMAISAPGLESRGVVWDVLVSQVDIMPTILDLLGIAAFETCQGRSLKPVIIGGEKEVNEFVAVEYTGGAAKDAMAVRSQRYKYVEEAGESFVYDLKEDPAEQKRVKAEELKGEMADEAARLRQSLRKVFGDK